MDAIIPNGRVLRRFLLLSHRTRVAAPSGDHRVHLMYVFRDQVHTIFDWGAKAGV
jgi:hypothetical protein